MSSCESLIFILTGIPLSFPHILRNFPFYSGSSKFLSVYRALNSMTLFLFLRILWQTVLLSPVIHSSLLYRKIKQPPPTALWLPCPHWHWSRPCDLLWSMGYEQKKYTPCFTRIFKSLCVVGFCSFPSASSAWVLEWDDRGEQRTAKRQHCSWPSNANMQCEQERNVIVVSSWEVWVICYCSKTDKC